MDSTDPALSVTARARTRQRDITPTHLTTMLYGMSCFEPLGPHGGRHFRRAVFDYRTDTPSMTEEELAPEDAILLFDGVFLLRPEINDQWDYRIFVEVPFAVTVERAILRDSDLFGSAEDDASALPRALHSRPADLSEIC